MVYAPGAAACSETVPPLVRPTPAAVRSPLPPLIARSAIAVEKYLLPWLYAYFAYNRGASIFDQVRDNPAEYNLLFFAGLTKDILVFVLMVFTGVTLLFSRRPTSLPDRLTHIVVPLAMSYYFFLYDQVDRLPAAMNRSLLPETWTLPCDFLALTCSVLGYGVAIWGLSYLRRSFALMVAVRKVVDGGPYALVRHPMYCGYILDQCGLVLASRSVVMLVLAVGFVLLLFWRARMEEAKLSQTSEDYRRYMQRTGFLLPRFGARFSRSRAS